MPNKRLMRPREVADQLRISKSTVYRWFWEGKLKGIKIGRGTLRIFASAVEDKIQEGALD